MSRFIARFVVETDEGFQLMTRYAQRMACETLDSQHPVAQSILSQHPAANWFERKAHDDFGIQFNGSYDTRPLVAHEHIAPNQFPMRKAFHEAALKTQSPSPYPYEVIEGETTYEIAVGPIHAGIIEPGHFHFSQAGEAMLHQEVRHFYKYRAIEKMLEGKTVNEAWPIISRISGHSSIAWQWAFAEAVADSQANPLPEAFRRKAALLLELERLAHHLTDLGFIPNDAGFAAALAWGSSLAERTRRQMHTLTGHRFGFDALLHPDINHNDTLSQFTQSIRDELYRFSDWIEGIPSLWDRLDTTGRLQKKQAIAYDVVGVVARACGLNQDVRSKNSIYTENGFELHTQRKGDVAARFRLRLAEALHSLTLIERLNHASITHAPFSIEGDQGEGEGQIESSLGELYLWLKLKEGVIDRCYARDPSFINWQALHLMMPGNIIADFPLINKSCDLSYAGNDL